MISLSLFACCCLACIIFLIDVMTFFLFRMNNPDPPENAAGNSTASLNNAKSAGQVCVSCATTKDNAFRAFQSALRASEELKKFESVAAEGMMLRQKHSEHLVYIEQLSSESQQKSDKICSLENENAEAKLKIAMLDKRNRDLIESAKDSQKHQKAANDLRRKLDDSLEALEQVHLKRVDFRTRFIDSSQLKANSELKKVNDRLKDQVTMYKQSNISMKNGSKRYNKLVNELAKLLRANDVEIPRKLQDEMFVLSHDGDGKQMTSANGDVSVLDDSDDDLADNVESQFLFLQASSGDDAGTSGSGTNTCPSYAAPLPTVSDDDEGIETHVREKKERVGAMERKQQRARDDVLVQSHSRSDDDHMFSQPQQGKSHLQPPHQHRQSPQKKKTGRSREKNVPVLPPITLEQATDGRGRNQFIVTSRTSVPVPAAIPARVDDPEMRQQSSSITGKRCMSVKQQQLEMMKNTNVKDFAARLREAEAAGNGQGSKVFVRNKIANATKPIEKPAMNILAESSFDHARVHSSGGRDLSFSDDNEMTSYSSSLDDSEKARKKQEKEDEELARRIQEEVYQQPRRSSRSRTPATPARKFPAGSSRTRTQVPLTVSCKKTMPSQRDIDIMPVGTDQQTCESVSDERITDVQSVEVEGTSDEDVGKVLLNMLDQVCRAVDTDVTLNCRIANESVVRSSESCDAGCPASANPVIPVAAPSARNLLFEMPTRAFKKPVQTLAQRQKPVSYSDDFMLDLLSGASTFTPSGKSRPIMGSQQTSCNVDVVDQGTPLCTTNAVEDGRNELPDAPDYRAVVDAVNPVKCIGQDVDLLSQGSGLTSPGKSRVDQLKQQDRIERSPSKTPRESMLQDDLLMSDSEDDGDDDLKMETNVPVVNDGRETKSTVRNKDMDHEKAVCELESGMNVIMEKVRVHSSQEVAHDETVSTEDGMITEKTMTESSTQIGVLPITTESAQEKNESISLNEFSIASIEKSSQVADSSSSNPATYEDQTLQSPRVSLDQTLDSSTLLPKSSAKRRSPSEGTATTRRSLTTRACKQRQEDATTTVKMARKTPIVTCPGTNSSAGENTGRRSGIRTSMKAPTRKSEVVQKRDEMNITSPDHLKEHENEEEQLEMKPSSRVSRVSRSLASPATSTRSKTSVQSPSSEEVKSSLASSAVLNVSVKKGRGRSKKVTDSPAMSSAIKKSTESSSGARKMPARAAKSPARAEQSPRRVAQKGSDDELLIDVTGDSSPDQVSVDEPSISKRPTKLPACPRVSMTKKNPLSRTADVGKMMKKNLQQKKAPVSVAKAVNAPASRKSLSRKSVGATQAQIPSASLSAEAVPATLNRRKRAMAHDVVPVGPNVKKSKATDASLLFEVLRQVVDGGMDSSEAQQKLNGCDHLSSLDESEVVSAVIDSMAEAVGDQWFPFGKNMERNQLYIIPVNERELTHVIDILTDTWTSLMKSVVTALSHRMISSAEQNASLFARMTRLIVTLARNCDAQDECLREVECVMKHTVERREPMVVVQMLSFACCAWKHSVKWVCEVIADEVDPRSKHLHRLLRLHAAVVPTEWKKFSKSCEISAAMNEGSCVVPANSNEANDWWDEMISNVTRIVDRGDAIQLPIADEIKLSTKVREYMSMALALYSRFTAVLGQSRILDSLRSAMNDAFEIVDLATFSVHRPRITGGSLDFDRGENVVPDQKKAIHAAIMMMIGSEVFTNGIIESPNRIKTPHHVVDLRAMLEDALPLCVRAKESGHEVLMVLERAMREWVTTMQHATKFSLTAAIGKPQFLH